MRPTLLALAVVSAAAPASAAHVYLNGVQIDGVTSQEFTQVKRVVIDAEGNVRIDAPEYEIEQLDAGAPAPPPPLLARRYWLVTTAPAEDVTVEVWAGPKLLRRIGPGEGPVVEEITALLKPGPNRLRVRAAKAGASPRSLPVLVGEATVGAGDEVALAPGRLAFDVGPGRETEATLEAR